MKKPSYPTVSLLLLTMLVASGVNAHGKKEHNAELPEFDAVSNEFGAFDPTLEPTRTVSVSMADTMRFSPEKLTIKAGDVVKFVVANDGKLKHEFVLGTEASLREHSALMVKFPNMEHEEPYMAHVDPGKEMEIVWQFTSTGDFEFGCLLPGHYDAGMRGSITVN